ncbi:MAG: phage tail tape measure protein [Sarcina sp.]
MSNEVVVKIGLSAREFQQGMRQMQNELRQSMSEFDLASEKAKLFGTTTDYLGAQVEKLSAKLEAETAMLEEQKVFITQLEGNQLKLAEAQKAVEVSLADLNNERKEALGEYGAESEQVKALDISIASLNKEYVALDRSIAANNTSLARASAQANRTEISTMRTEASLNGLNRQLATRHLDSFASGMGKISTGADRVASKLMPLSLGIGVVGAASAYNSIKFEESMSKVGTIADTSQVPISTLKKEILNLSTQTGTSASDIAEATYQAISAGRETKDAVEFVAQANKLATAGFANSADVVKTLAVAMNSYGMKASQVGSVSDKLLEVQNLGITSVKELGQTLAPVIQIAGGAHVSFNDLTTSMALLTQASGDTSLSATQLKGMIAELNKTGSKSSNILEKLTHKSFSELMKSGMSLGQVIQLLQGYADKSHTSINNLFGNIRAGGAALAMSQAGLGSYNTMLGKIKNSAGLTDKSFKEMTNTTGFKLKKAFIELQNSSIKLGDSLTPIIIIISKGVTKIAASINKLSPAQLKIITEVGLSIIAFTGFMKVLSLVTGGLGSLAKGLSSSIKFFMKGEEGISGFTKVLKGTSKIAKGTGSIIAKSAKGIGKAFSLMGKGALKTFSLMGKGISNSAKLISKGAVQSFSLMKTGIMKSMEGIQTGSIKAFNLMKTGTLKSIGFIKDGAIKSFSAMKSGILTASSAIGNGFSKMASVIGSGAKSIISGLRAVWATMLANPIILIIAAIVAIGVALYECYEHCAWFRNKVDYIWKEIQILFQGFLNFFSDVFKGKFTGVLGALVAPLRFFMQNCATAWTSIKLIFNGFIEFFEGVFTGNWSKAFAGLKEIFAGIWNSLSGIASNAMNAVLSIVMPIINTISSAFKGLMSGIHAVGHAASSIGHAAAQAIGFSVVIPHANEPIQNKQSKFLAMPINQKKPVNFSLASQSATSLNSLNSLTTGVSSTGGILKDSIDEINIEGIINNAMDKIISKIDNDKDHKEINLKVILDGKQIAYASNSYQNRLNGKEIELQKRLRGIT